MAICIFCKIINGEIPSYKVWEDDENLAFLDIFPIKAGHTLIVPKRHCSYFFDMPDKDYQNLSSAAQTVAKLLVKTLHPKSGKVGSIVYGLEVDHAHIHLVPLDKLGDLNFANKHAATKEELEQTLEKIKSAL